MSELQNHSPPNFARLVPGLVILPARHPHYHRVNVPRSTAPTERHSGQPTEYREDREACASNGLPPPRPSPLSPGAVDVGSVVDAFAGDDVLENWVSACDVVCRDVVDRVEGCMVELVVVVRGECVEERDCVVEVDDSTDAEVEVEVAKVDLGAAVDDSVLFEEDDVVKTIDRVVVKGAAVVLVVCGNVTSFPSQI